jgi:hypothetical protein
MLVTSIARATLDGDEPVRLLPAGTRSYARVRPLGGDRYRVLVLDAVRGMVVDDEGTLAELRRQHPQIRFVSGD